jgi:hypothetical protein
LAGQPAKKENPFIFVTITMIILSANLKGNSRREIIYP